jgi:hypothetical protein
MYAVIRRYQGNVIMDAIAPRQAEVEALLRAVPGFVAYYAVRTGDGGATITVCQDQAGTAESTRRAGEWVRQNVPEAGGTGAPEVTEGEVFINF